MPKKPITIVGGGLAGLALGIALRKRAIPVTVFEAGNYPRHRVCGEFISGRGQETLSRLGLRKLLERSGAVSATSAAFFSRIHSTPPRPLPAHAICLSRFTMDHVLALEFERLDGDLRVGQRWPAVDVPASTELDRQKTELQPEGVVRATGRRLQPTENGVRWFGMKAHSRNVALTADLEVHVSPRGYVGLCRVNGDAVNVCGLFRRNETERGRLVRESQVPARPESPSVLHSQKRPLDLLRGDPGSLLYDRLEDATFDDNSFCSVAGLSLRPQRAGERSECCIGDAITMTPPVTGNGMSMAFESAEMATEPLIGWSEGRISWIETCQQIAFRCDNAFARRLAWATWLQRMIFMPSLENLLVHLLSRSQWFWRSAFDRTR